MASDVVHQRLHLPRTGAARFRAWVGPAPVLLTAVAICDIASALRAPASNPICSEPATKTAPDKAIRDPPPIAFFLAKGEPDACGPGCGEWIAADGTIDRNAGQRLRACSAGRETQAADLFPLARRIVERGNRDRTDVARTRHDRGRRPHHSARLRPRHDRESACDAIKRSGRDLAAELRTVRTLCNSSCVYALIGAKVREVTAGARIGVHTIALGEFDKDGSVKSARTGPLSAEDTEKLKDANGSSHNTSSRWASTAACSTPRPGSSMSGCATSAATRSRASGSTAGNFTRAAGPSTKVRGLVVVKFLTENKGGDRKQYRTTKTSSAARAPRDVRVTFSRELAATDRPASIAVSARGGDFVLPPRRGKPILGYNDIEMEDRVARVPLAFFEEAAAGDTIEFAEAPDIAALDKPPRRTKLSTAGLRHAIHAVGQRCR